MPLDQRAWANAAIATLGPGAGSLSEVLDRMRGTEVTLKTTDGDSWSGRILLVASGEEYALSPGDVVVFRGDQRHSYVNPGSRVAVAYSVVVIARR